jgi:dihydroorotate dehydrogenase electron transfer subunit
MVKPVGPASSEIASMRAGESLDVSPPLGKGFPPAQVLAPDPLLLVGGGFGIAPLHFLAKQLEAISGAVDYRVLYGGRTRDDVELEVLEGLEGEVLPSTDDGSLGFHGTCVELAQRVLNEAGKRASRFTVLTCGSHAMMQALFSAVSSHVRQIYVSVEEIMGCGVGVCMGCVVPTPDGLVPACTHGPVFAGPTVFGEEVQRVTT